MMPRPYTISHSAHVKVSSTLGFRSPAMIKWHVMHPAKGLSLCQVARLMFEASLAQAPGKL